MGESRPGQGDSGAAAPLDFYFDFGSPYAYLASLRLEGLAAVHGRTVAWRPILLGPVFAVTGSRPNLEIPLRGAYLRRDVERIARRIAAPLVWPQTTALNSLVPARAVWWLEPHDPAAAARLAARLFHACWGEGIDITGADAVATVAAGLGIDGAALRSGLADPAVKERLRAETAEAIARGVFGAPFVIADGEPFWGWDRLDLLDSWLATGGW